MLIPETRARGYRLSATMERHNDHARRCEGRAPRPEGGARVDARTTASRASRWTPTRVRAATTPRTPASRLRPPEAFATRRRRGMPTDRRATKEAPPATPPAREAAPAHARAIANATAVAPARAPATTTTVAAVAAARDPARARRTKRTRERSFSFSFSRTRQTRSLFPLVPPSPPRRSEFPLSLPRRPPPVPCSPRRRRRRPRLRPSRHARRRSGATRRRRRARRTRIGPDDFRVASRGLARRDDERAPRVPRQRRSGRAHVRLHRRFSQRRRRDGDALARRDSRAHSRRGAMSRRREGVRVRGSSRSRTSRRSSRWTDRS